MTDEIVPALNTEEWLQYGADRTVLRDFAAGKRPWCPTRRFSDEQKLHAVAAMALFGQPFGFTHRDVDLLENQAAFHEHRGATTDQVLVQQLRSLAARITALLPPRGVEPPHGD